MHLLALGAFWHGTFWVVDSRSDGVLMHLLALGAFWLPMGDALDKLVYRAS